MMSHIGAKCHSLRHNNSCSLYRDLAKPRHSKRIVEVQSSEPSTPTLSLKNSKLKQKLTKTFVVRSQLLKPICFKTVAVSFGTIFDKKDDFGGDEHDEREWQTNFERFFIKENEWVMISALSCSMAILIAFQVLVAPTVLGEEDSTISLYSSSSSSNLTEPLMEGILELTNEKWKIREIFNEAVKVTENVMEISLGLISAPVKFAAQTITWKATVISVLSLTCCASLFMFFFQRKFLYFPSKQSYYRPEDWKLKYEDLRLITEDNIQIHGWFFPHKDSSNVSTILFLQGSHSNMSGKFNELMELRKANCNVMMISYRGYGESKGSPSEKGLIEDATTALNHLFQRKDIDSSRIIIYGQALGGAVAIAVSLAFPQLYGLILENTFTNLIDLLSSKSKIFKLISPFLKDSWRSDQRITNLKIPILFIAGDADDQVPPFSASLLHHQASSSPFKSLSIIKAGGHHDTLFQPSTLSNAILPFIHALSFGVVHSTLSDNNPLAGS